MEGRADRSALRTGSARSSAGTGDIRRGLIGEDVGVKAVALGVEERERRPLPTKRPIRAGGSDGCCGGRVAMLTRQLVRIKKRLGSAMVTLAHAFQFTM